ncbi:hypothetical protein PHPALM_29902, partial [Phytophthora palmivora]
MAGSLVYFFDIWVGDLTGQLAILGLDFMVLAGIRLDLAYGSISLPDELSERRQLYSDKARLVTVGEHIQIEIGQSVELRLHLRTSDHEKFWVTRGDHWVPTVITNISDKTITLQEDVRIGRVIISRECQVLSRWDHVDMGWQNLALQASVEGRSEQVDLPAEPPELMVDRPSYPSPRAILKNPKVLQVQESRSARRNVEDQNITDRLDLTKISAAQVDPASRTKDQLLVDSDPPDRTSDQLREAGEREQGVDDPDLIIGRSVVEDLPEPIPTSVLEVLSRELGDPVQAPSIDLHPVIQDPTIERGDQADPSSLGSDPNVHYHEDSDLCAEDMDQELAVIPAISLTTDEVRIEDEDKQDIITPNRLDEVLVVKKVDQATQITAV